MTQAQLRQHYALPASAFDIESWQVLPRVTMPEGQHLVRFKMLVAEASKTVAYEWDMVIGTKKEVELYECKSHDSNLQGRTHDYSSPQWGHDYIFTPLPGNKGRMSGWGFGIQKSDYIIMLQSKRNRMGPTTRYIIDSITYCQDPADMWHAEVSFAPRGVPA